MLFAWQLCRPPHFQYLFFHVIHRVAKLDSWSLILFGTENRPRVLVDYLSSRNFPSHSSSTQPRQATSASDFETTILRPAVDTAATATKLTADSNPTASRNPSGLPSTGIVDLDSGHQFSDGGVNVTTEQTAASKGNVTHSGSMLAECCVCCT